MNAVELIRERHSVRSYQRKAVEPEKLALIQAELQRLNEESGLHMQFMPDAGKVLSSLMARAIGWKYVPSYIALVGPDTPELDEKCGWYGEALVLFLQSIGLNTCWVGAFRADQVKAEVHPGEKLLITIALGYGEDAGKPHKSKSPEQVTDVTEMPDWFRNGVDCALLAPTAINQQKFMIRLEGNTPVITASGKGPFLKVDLGIVKYHFAVGSGVRPE